VIGALAVSGLGVVLLAVSEFWENGVAASMAAVLAGAVIAIAIALWWSAHKPHLGTED
jgi:hypothetical protein